MLAMASVAANMSFAAHSQEAPFNAAAGDPAAFASRPVAVNTNPPKPTVQLLDRGQFHATALPAAAPERGAAAAADKGEGGQAVMARPASTAAGSPQKALAAKPGKPASDGKYHDIIKRYASAYGVPAPLAHAIVRLESNYRAGARGRAGEIGLMQIKHSTARGMGYTGSAKGLYDPETNIKFGMKYLAKALSLGSGETCATVLRYNAGHGAKRMNPTSAAYCSKVKRLLGSA
jgi:soluble lytic murein transglycosylase-like protein